MKKYAKLSLLFYRPRPCIQESELFVTFRWYYIDPEWKHDIWFPTLIIRNMQAFETIASIKSNEKLMITRIPDKRFYYVAMHMLTFTCGLKFDRFPFDQHDCLVQVVRTESGMICHREFRLGSPLSRD